MGLQLVGCQQFAMADIEDALVDVHVCPVGTASLGDAELAHHVKLGGIGIDPSQRKNRTIIWRYKKNALICKK